VRPARPAGSLPTFRHNEAGTCACRGGCWPHVTHPLCFHVYASIQLLDRVSQNYAQYRHILFKTRRMCSHENGYAYGSGQTCSNTVAVAHLCSCIKVETCLGVEACAFWLCSYKSQHACTRERACFQKDMQHAHRYLLDQKMVDFIATSLAKYQGGRRRPEKGAILKCPQSMGAPAGTF
jgi:hypothetical protein